MKLLSLLLGLLLIADLRAQTEPETLKIAGSTVLAGPILDAARILKSERGVDVEVQQQSSSAGIGSLGDGWVQLAMVSRDLSASDRAQYPTVNFRVAPIGAQVTSVIVSRDVYEMGIRALSRDQLLGIYRGKIKNWKDLGGADKPLVFFNWREGLGTWEIFAEWLYGNIRRAPLGKFAMVGSNEEARNSVEFTVGSISLCAPRLSDGKNSFPIALKGDDGTLYEPSPAAVRDGKYPLSRPLSLLSNDAPVGPAKLMVELMLSPRGQDLLKKHGHLGLDELAP